MTSLLRFVGQILLILFFCGNSFAQTSAQKELTIEQSQLYNNQIQSVYGDEWMNVNKEAVSALKFCFSNRISYLSELLTTGDKYPLLSSFPLMNKLNPEIVAINYAQFNPNTFVPIHYNLPFFSNKKEVIRVDGTNYIIVIEPANKL